MASILKTGEIQFDDGRILFVDTVITGKDYLELAQLLPKLVAVIGRAGLVGFPFGAGGGFGGPGGGGGGAAGAPGGPGPQGLTGVQGVTGPSMGPQGATGLQGPTGSQGLTGIQGTTGVQGATGLQGQTGIQGTTGAQGVTGIQGATGVSGATGVQGVTGIQGLTGLSGSPASQIVEATDTVAVAGAFAVLANMTVTPAAGTYLVWFRGTFKSFPTPVSQMLTEARIRHGGTAVAASLSQLNTSGAFDESFELVSIARVTVNGAEAIDVETQFSGTGTVNAIERQLMIEIVT